MLCQDRSLKNFRTTEEPKGSVVHIHTNICREGCLIATTVTATVIAPVIIATTTDKATT